MFVEKRWNILGEKAYFSRLDKRVFERGCHLRDIIKYSVATINWTGISNDEDERFEETFWGLNIARQCLLNETRKEGSYRPIVVACYFTEGIIDLSRIFHHFSFRRQESRSISRDTAPFPVIRPRQTIEGIPFNCSPLAPLSVSERASFHEILFTQTFSRSGQVTAKQPLIRSRPATTNLNSSTPCLVSLAKSYDSAIGTRV